MPKLSAISKITSLKKSDIVEIIDDTIDVAEKDDDTYSSPGYYWIDGAPIFKKKYVVMGFSNKYDEIYFHAFDNEDHIYKADIKEFEKGIGWQTSQTLRDVNSKTGILENFKNFKNFRKNILKK